jgi:type IV secretory pathway TraG/TraD family ATPase VirD4
MMVTKFQIDAMSRADILERDRTDFYLYVDEFQNFATDSFATILSEARKYKLNLVMANQYIDQMTETVR